jgi:hypothetical protein
LSFWYFAMGSLWGTSRDGTKEQCFLNLPMQTDVRFATDNTGIHLWRIDGVHRHVLFANRTEHLTSAGGDHR